MYVAMSVLRELMGERWLETYIMYGAKKKNVLSLIEADPASETAGQLRLMDLAEMMYNLQPVPGIFDCLDRMREGDIEGVLAELNLGRMLYWHGIPLRYVERTGRQGDDYDMVFQFPNGMYGLMRAPHRLTHLNLISYLQMPVLAMTTEDICYHCVLEQSLVEAR